MEYSLVGDRVISDDGRVAIQHISSNPTNVMVGKVGYVFTARNQVSLAWIPPEDADKVLLSKSNKTCSCGGNSSKPKFHLASLINVNLHIYNNREGKV